MEYSANKSYYKGLAFTSSDIILSPHKNLKKDIHSLFIGHLALR
jgi:hypothetical protein